MLKHKPHAPAATLLEPAARCPLPAFVWIVGMLAPSDTISPKNSRKCELCVEYTCDLV